VLANYICKFNENVLFVIDLKLAVVSAVFIEGLLYFSLRVMLSGSHQLAYQIP